MKKIDVTQPYAMTSPFADGVYSSVSTSDFEIPADTSTAPDDTCVIDDGFLPITSTDLDDGGIAPERKNFNGMFYLSTDQRFYLQNGGFITYNSNVATAIGGYPQDAVLGFIDGQGTYKLVRSLIDDNTNDFTQDETLIDGAHWEEIAMGGGGSGYQMFDIVLKDHVLDYEETLGFAQLGTYVYKEAIAGTRYGYPDFYAKCVEEYTGATSSTATISGQTVTIYTATNGHIFYDIADKSAFDDLYTALGIANYYGLDTTNERVFLPRNDYLTKYVANGTHPVRGNGKTLGLTNGSVDVGLTFTTQNSICFAGHTNAYDVNYDTTYPGTNASLGKYGVVTDGSKSGIVADITNTSNGLYAYMVVGNQSSWSGMTDVVNQGMTILEQVNAGLATKLDLNLSNITNATKIALTDYAMPSNTYTDLTLGASDSTYTAPADGWFSLSKLAGSDWYTIHMKSLDENDNVLLSLTMNGYRTTELKGFLPVKKGQKFSIWYNATGATQYFRFVYAVGSESEAS